MVHFKRGTLSRQDKIVLWSENTHGRFGPLPHPATISFMTTGTMSSFLTSSVPSRVPYTY